MGVSIYPVLDKDLPGFDATQFGGKALAAVVFAEGSAFAVLEQFNSQNEDELAAFVSDQTGQEIGTFEVPTQEWFAPEAGLEVVRQLLAQARAAPEGWEPEEFQAGLVEDLRALENVLLLAQEHGAHFYLTVDF